MNIAFNTLVENPYKPTGSTVFFQKILPELELLDRVNHYYLLVSPQNQHLFRITQPNFHYVNCYISNEHNRLRILMSQLIVPIRLWQHKIDIYFSPQNMSPFLVLKNCKVVVYLYGTHHWQKDSTLGAAKTLYRRVLSLCARVQTSVFIANSVACKQDIVRHLKVQGDRVRVVSEALDHQLFNTRALVPAEEALLRSHGLETGGYILFVSMIYYYKNVHTLVEAFGKLCQDVDTPYGLVLIGRVDAQHTNQGTYLDMLRELACKYQVENRVKFLGYIPHDQLSRFYRGARLFVQPSLYETFGKSVIEAMACGVPVVGANTGATPEVIADAGLLFDPSSADDLCNKMRQMLSDDDLSRRFVNRGLEHAQQFTFERQAAGLIESFNIAAHPGSRRTV